MSEISHTQIYNRLSETEERIMATEGRIMAMIKW